MTPITDAHRSRLAALAPAALERPEAFVACTCVAVAAIGFWRSLSVAALRCMASRLRERFPADSRTKPSP
jgi:hypothetical protein